MESLTKSLTEDLTDNLTQDLTRDPKEGLKEELRKDDLRTAVRDRYAEIAQIAQTTTEQTEGDSTCCGSGASCCSTDAPSTATWAEISVGLGYTDHDVASVPEGSNLGLGCGNPQAIADLKRGETVLDLGSGAGFDCFLAARQVGETGSVIGVDMTPQMVSAARDNARSANATNIEFRLGEIERLPVADQAVDVIISNCVINLSPDKRSVFREAFRVLKPGGRLAISDIVASAPLPDHVRRDLSLYTGCMAGASEIGTLQDYLTDAGFADISIKPKSESREFIRQWAPEHALEDMVVSAVIQATKPASVGAAQSTTVTACCSAQEQEACCEPEAKSECCDETGNGECGCR